MNTAINRLVLCLVFTGLWLALGAQDKLAMNIKRNDIETITAKDTLDNILLSKPALPSGEHFTVTPNESTNAILVVASDIEEGAYTFEILSLSGERVYNEVSQLSRNHHKIIDISYLEEKSYYIIIRSDKIRFKQKITI